jgi:hypothetical protein
MTTKRFWQEEGFSRKQAIFAAREAKELLRDDMADEARKTVFDMIRNRLGQPNSGLVEEKPVVLTVSTVPV